jgi:hypothetical protein
MALGSDARGIMRLIVSEAAVLVVLGLIAGLAGTIALRCDRGAALRHRGDPRVMLSAVAILAVTSLVACLGPTRRAVHVSPLMALSRQ